MQTFPSFTIRTKQVGRKSQTLCISGSRSCSFFRGKTSKAKARGQASSLEELMGAMIEAMIDAHSADPELYELLATEVPHRADGTRDFAVRLHGAFRLAIASRARQLKKDRDLDKLVFVVTNMVESLSHAALFRRPPRLSLAAAKTEVVRAVLAYLLSQLHLALLTAEPRSVSSTRK